MKTLFKSQTTTIKIDDHSEYSIRVRELSLAETIKLADIALAFEEDKDLVGLGEIVESATTIQVVGHDEPIGLSFNEVPADISSEIIKLVVKVNESFLMTTLEKNPQLAEIVAELMTKLMPE